MANTVAAYSKVFSSSKLNKMKKNPIAQSIKVLNPFVFKLERKEHRFYEIDTKPVYVNGEYRLWERKGTPRLRPTASDLRSDTADRKAAERDR